MFDLLYNIGLPSRQKRLTYRQDTAQSSRAALGDRLIGMLGNQVGIYSYECYCMWLSRSTKPCLLIDRLFKSASAVQPHCIVMQNRQTSFVASA